MQLYPQYSDFKAHIVHLSKSDSRVKSNCKNFVGNFGIKIKAIYILWFTNEA